MYMHVHSDPELTTCICRCSGFAGACCAEKNECDFSVHHVHFSCGGGSSKCIDGINKFFCKCGPGWTGGGYNKVCVGAFVLMFQFFLSYGVVML